MIHLFPEGCTGLHSWVMRGQRNGLITMPCGTVVLRVRVDEQWWSNWTCWALLVKKSNNQLHIGSLMSVRLGINFAEMTVLSAELKLKQHSGISVVIFHTVKLRVSLAAVSPEAHLSFVNIKVYRHIFGTCIMKSHHKNSSTKREKG